MYLVISMILCLSLFMVKLTGNIVHTILGMIFVVIAIVHIVKEKKKYTKLDRLMIVLLIFMFMSGMAVHFMKDMLIMKIIHILSGCAFFIALVRHVIYYQRFKRKGKKIDVS